MLDIGTLRIRNLLQDWRLLYSELYSDQCLCCTFQKQSAEKQKEVMATLSVLQDERSRLEQTLLKKVFGSREIDHHLAIGLLLGMTRRNALSTIKVGMEMFRNQR